MNKIDAQVFFRLLFGSESFEPWVGELQLATQAQQLAKTAGLVRMPEKTGSAERQTRILKLRALLSQRLKRRQKIREVKCASHVRTKLDAWIAKPGWETEAQNEAVLLAKSQQGPDLLITLGLAYRQEAQNFLDSQAPWPISSAQLGLGAVKQMISSWKQQANLSLLIASGLFKLRSLGGVGILDPSQPPMEELAYEKQQRAKASLDEALPKLLLIAWNFVIRDVRNTSDRVAQLLTHDASVSLQERIARAKGLKRLGEIFRLEGLRRKTELASRGDDSESPFGGFASSKAAQNKINDALAKSVGRASGNGGGGGASGGSANTGTGSSASAGGGAGDGATTATTATAATAATAPPTTHGGGGASGGDGAGDGAGGTAQSYKKQDPATRVDALPRKQLQRGAWRRGAVLLAGVLSFGNWRHELTSRRSCELVQSPTCFAHWV
eukprot:TRINITY_DN2414_c0_g5_i1.p1 TRINITY_DN2414_c0_g5~~TRINITY_DN2414_c0_g5_i1.p1  ORF type:complete len:441 (+),score=121.89 TRINITY_DN2414_c0_g5_i1:682-2004(+)